MVAHHQRHGGISRVEKIKYAHYNIIGDPSPERKIEEDAQKYSELVFEKVINTRWIPGAETFVKKKILTHLDLWDVKHRPPPRANSPPTESFILYDESSSPSADDYIIDADYPVDLSRRSSYNEDGRVAASFAERRRKPTFKKIKLRAKR